jgi:hypothetical protein
MFNYLEIGRLAFSGKTKLILGCTCIWAFSCFFCIYGLSAQQVRNRSASLSFPTVFERDSNQTATYDEGIGFYKQLATAFPKQMRLQEAGFTDGGKPLHLVVLGAGLQTFTPQEARGAQKAVLLINNAIHAGEPEGVDATQIFVRNLLLRPNFAELMKNWVILVVPFYNIDGVLNRSATSRANQNGPTTYGFRGNAQNLDLNRDFVKCDTRNAQSFNQLFAAWRPEIFVDNHTSNGADYAYTFTLISTQKDKLAPILSRYQQENLIPALHEGMKAKGFDVSPYVNFEELPDKGITGFLDLPRYSTGYAALHNSIGFMPETHMLKPFPSRVRATLAFEETVFEVCRRDFKTITENRKRADESLKTQTTFALNWQLDTARRETLAFKGFTAAYKPSEVSGLPRLYYDRNLPYEKNVPFFPHFNATVLVEKPKAYLVPQAYKKVIELLKMNGIEMRTLQTDTVVEADFYRILDFKSSAQPYEGHHPNRDVRVKTEVLKRQFYKGDFYIECNQIGNRYLVETLEVQAADSYFSWNFFDGILNQKEGYSDYVFEDRAAEILKRDSELRKQLEEKRRTDPTFAASAAAQLDFVYKHSEYYEPTHRLYPIARIRN